MWCFGEVLSPGVFVEDIESQAAMRRDPFEHGQSQKSQFLGVWFETFFFEHVDVELIVDLDNDKVARKQHLKGKHSYIDANYMKAVEAACLANEAVQAEIDTLDLPVGATVVVEPWAYATDGMNDMTDRVTMVWLPCAFANSGPNANSV